MMQIIFERAGGFMGRKVSLELNLADLPADQARTLKLLVDESNFINLTDPPPKDSAPDGFTYSITVKTETIRHTINASDTNLPDALRPLLDELVKRSRSH
ncbi:MAG: hypothetical protein HY864_00345 [Chloroflexi bacterium]|nr:hypothetical protein [Chloroflexota bacterium]